MGAAEPLRFACDCGILRGNLDASALRGGFRVVCYCPDCRAAELFLNRPDPAPSPVDLFQTTPDRVQIDTGTECLGLFRLGPKGLFRWYATCCDAPMFNTLAKAGLPFVGLHSGRVAGAEPLGPVRGKSFVPTPGGRPKFEGSAAMTWGALNRMAAARLSGRWRRTPFFDTSTGEPTVRPQILTRQERAALYP